MIRDRESDMSRFHIDAVICFEGECWLLVRGCGAGRESTPPCGEESGQLFYINLTLTIGLRR